MSQKHKKIYFTSDFSPENIQKLKAEGWIIRDRRAVNIGDFIEEANEYGGDVPEYYKPKTQQLTVQLNTEIAPELQKTIDDAKAECEKVAAENDALKAEIEGIKTERDALVVKAKELEEQLNVSHAELVAVKNAGTTGDLLSENTDATTTKETKKK
ncbi:hypothetical protein [Acinetobacter sp. Ver3]|uniref:hypothetical protein n=1 Tax=Acinetobacter sp. Ver3 TaxID=466088 RepID=UPI00044A1AB1|nr:hypothetical protein [Acinetobacter sp. Ver3]EZQ10743.1 hypothetical protein CL42_06315 [Acinetobacter sp. Ver3]